MNEEDRRRIERCSSVWELVISEYLENEKNIQIGRWTQLYILPHVIWGEMNIPEIKESN